MSISLDAKQQNIKDIFQIGSKQYVIPDYQRAYSWGYDECYKLFDDITEAFKPKREKEEEEKKSEEYFLGNIIIAKNNENKLISELEVIDGQQRLTSLLIFLKILNILYPKHKGPYKCIWFEDDESDEEFPRIKSEIIEIKEEKGLLENIFNISKEELDKDIKLIIKDGELDLKQLRKNSPSKFYQNALIFYFLLDNFFKQNDKYKIKDFIIYFLNDVSMLPIELYGDDRKKTSEKALKIFETINNRGLELSDADIFKAKLYYLSENTTEFINRWKELKEKSDNLGIKINDLFRYYSHIIRGKERKVGSEIGLRDFFTTLSYSPLKLKNSKEIMNDLFKIVNLLEQLDFIRKEKEPLSKWIQILELYTNQYPKYAVIVYLFNHGFDNEFEKFLENLIRFIYYKGSTTTIKYDIYNLIYDITFKREMMIFNFYDMKDIYLGRLKKGFALLGYYLTHSNSIYPYKIERIISAKDTITLSEDWKQLESFEQETALNSLGNMMVYEDKKEYEELKNSFKNSYQLFEEYNRNINNKILNFIKGTND